ncbi:MAG: SAM-dependent methyltransferase [Herminiimonas sp.]|nr:SAM-dependent methyltransferase [Herminiimonas sp.]
MSANPEREAEAGGSNPQSIAKHTQHAVEQASSWVLRFASLIPSGDVLDLACGGGRHARLLASLGHHVVAVDRDAAALERCKGQGIETMLCDLEGADAAAAWPFPPERFSGIVVTNYLHRPLFPFLFQALAPSGILIVETFADGNARFGKPSRPDFLLQPGELLQQAARHADLGIRVIAYEDGYVAAPRPAMIQRICLARVAAGEQQGTLFALGT